MQAREELLQGCASYVAGSDRLGVSRGATCRRKALKVSWASELVSLQAEFSCVREACVRGEAELKTGKLILGLALEGVLLSRLEFEGAKGIASLLRAEMGLGGVGIGDRAALIGCDAFFLWV